MEQFQRNRLELRKQRLRTHLEGAEEVLNQYKLGVAIEEQEVIRWHTTLKQSVGSIQVDMDKYATTQDMDTDLLNEVLEIQLKAEDALVEMDIIKSRSKEPTPNQTSMKLPKLQLLKFNGDILKYSEFWDVFEANIHSQNIKPVEKLAYLLSSLEGKAKESLEGLSMTNDNYPVALETLKDRYGQKNNVVDSHYEALSKMKRSGYTADGCRKNLNEINKHLRVLSSLGENPDSSQLRSLIMNKFPDKVLYELNLLMAHNQSVSSIRSTLEIIIGAMEKAQVQVEPTVPISSTEAFHVGTRRPVFQRGKQLLSRPNKNPKPSEVTNRKRSAASTHSMTVKRTKRSCIFCEGDHYNDECDKVKSIEERRKKLSGRCFLCLREGHLASSCTRYNKCYHCKGKHNRALCPTRKPPGKILANSYTVNFKGQGPKTKSFLQTATAQVVHNRKTINCRLLLDCGSSRSYITSGLAKHLDMTSDNKDLLLIFTFGAEKATETLSPCSDIVIKTKRGIEKEIHVNVVPHITDRIPTPDIPKTNLVDVLADDSLKDQSIDMLIGNDYYFSFMRNNTVQIDKDLFLVDTDFGWVISGHLNMDKQEDENVLTVATYHQSSKECSCYTDPDLPLRQSDIKFLWSLENIGITDSVRATREDEAVQHFNDTVMYHEGRYHVKWPWTSNPPQMPTNYGLAYGRLKGLLQRLDETTLQEYNEILMNQLKAEIIEVVHIESEEVSFQSVPPKHYLPHHIVEQSGKRGRVVYDASARVKDELSLNECLYQGPCMLQDLTPLLLNFRTHKIGIVADVEKAFLQVGLQEEDRDVTRFLWLKDITKPVSNEKLLHFRFTRVPFGIVSSPFLLSATIRHHISQKNTDLLKSVADKCYVDNLVTGINTTADAFQLFKETRAVFEELSMNLRDWTSNDKPFVQMVPEPCRANEANEMKVLGLLWDKKEDVLTLNVNDDLLSENSQEKVTKRVVLRTLASVYDPCGIVSPVLMPIKLFLQELWRKDYKWDAPISQELSLKWRDLKRHLGKIKGIKIPRYVEADDNVRTEYELHCFTDAAKDSYAAVAYLRCDNGSKIKTAFLMSKSRIVPLERGKKTENKDERKQKRKLTIPQLELLGCVIGNRLLTYLKETIELPITRQYLWTDSLVALSWIHSNKLLPPFIANRIEDIKRNTAKETCYVNTMDNPADIATRPELWTQKKNVWLNGPMFLSRSKDKWPKDRELKSHHNLASLSAVVEGLEEQSPDYIPLEMTTDNTDDGLEEQSPDYIPLEMTTDNTDDGLEEQSPDYIPLMTTDNTDEELNHNKNQVSSQVLEIKALQQKYYPEETKGKQTSLSRNLDLFMDVDGLLRCRGRMTHANWSYDMKYPILLPRGCEFTDHVITEIHVKNYHVGPPHTLSLVRHQYWIPRGRPVVERVIRKCPQCVKQGGGPYSLPPPPALPVERANYSTPYTYTGIDYFGPVYVDTENGQQKRWVCLLTCLAVRAIHMEIVKNLTAEECMMALRRFMSTRGVPAVIVSDNALYFKLCSEVLQSVHCIKNNIKWKFIPQLAPWHGGFYERLVGLVKNCMKRTLEKQLLNDTQVLTVIKEIEAVVNSRPLTRVGPDMEVILRPCDFLSLGNCLNLEMADICRPEPTDSLVKQSLLEGWKRGQKMLSQFKNMFINQYLTSLRERYQHSHKQPRIKSHKEPRVGDLVEIKGESKNRNNWKVGKIINLIQSVDGNSRVAQVQVGDGIFTRSIALLYPLELEEPLPPQVSQPEVMESMEIDTNDLEPTGNEPDIIQLPRLTEETEQTEILTESQQVSETGSTRVIEEEERSNGVGSNEELPMISESISDEYCETPQIIDDDMNEEIVVQSKRDPRDEVVKRAAAIRARERIAEWTSQLFITL